MEDGPANYDVHAVEAFAGRHVRVHLDDGTEHSGMLRTELLSDRSVSVYIAGSGDEGATLISIGSSPSCRFPLVT